MSTFAGDVRYALRAMRSHPGYSAVAVASLALGIGVNTAIFSAVDQALLKTLPVPQPDQIVYVSGSRIGAYPFYREFRDQNQVFSGLLASGITGKAGVRPEGAPEVELADINWVSGNYFSVLRVGAARGRVLTQADDQKLGGSPVVVLSYSYWEKRFGADPNVIGRKFVVDGYPLEIVGVAERAFGGVIVGDSYDAFSPITMMPAVERSKAEVWDSPNMFWLAVLGRLKPGVSIEQAQASLRVLAPQIEDTLADRWKRSKYKRRPVDVVSAANGLPFAREQMQDPLRILSIATGFVLLIACANVANLLLARAAGRSREIAVRLAVGASRWRLVRQLMTESLLLAVFGALAGLGMAYWGVRGLASIASWGDNFRLHVDLHLFAYAIGITLATGLLFGLFPAIRGTRTDLATSMKEGGNSSAAGKRFRMGKILIAAQVALSLALLVGAGLFVQTLRNLRNVDAGFQREHALIVDVDPSNLGYTGQGLRAFYDRLLDKVRSIPGVRAASASAMTPFGNYARSRSFSAEGYQPKEGEDLTAFSNPVSRDYFATMGIPMLLGRDFRDTDEPAVVPERGFLSMIGRTSGSSSEPPKLAMKSVILNESLARHLFGSQSPVGRRISFDDRYKAEGSMEIIGVVRDVRYARLKATDEFGMIYEPAWGEGADPRWIGIRTVGDPKAVISAVRAELRKLDPNVPILTTRTMNEYVDSSIGRERMLAMLCAFFGVLALALAAVGLYGVMAYAVAERTREVGIRMALGAGRRDVVGMVVRESLVPVAAGIVAGLAGALALTRLVAGTLFGVKPQDPVSLASAVLLLLGVGLLASAIPARRASRVEPTVALRYE